MKPEKQARNSIDQVVLLIGRKFASTNQKRYSDLDSGYVILRRHFVGKPGVAARNLALVFSQAPTALPLFWIPLEMNNSSIFPSIFVPLLIVWLVYTEPGGFFTPLKFQICFYLGWGPYTLDGLARKKNKNE